MGGSEWVSHLASIVLFGSLALALGCGVKGVKLQRSGLYFLAGFFALPMTLYFLGGKGGIRWIGVAFMLTAFVAGLLARRRDQRPARAVMLVGLSLAFFTICVLATAKPVVTGESGSTTIFGDRVP